MVKQFSALVIFFISITVFKAQAQELGQWEVSRFQLQTGLGGPNPKSLETNLFDSYLQLNWQLAPFYDFRLEWGEREFFVSPIWSQGYDAKNQELWGIRQAYLFFQNERLGFKIGYLPTVFGAYDRIAQNAEINIPYLALNHHLWTMGAKSAQLSFKFDEWQSRLQLLPETTGYTVIGHFSYRPLHALGLDLGIWSTRQEASFFSNQNYWSEFGWNQPLQSWSHVRLSHLTLSRYYDKLSFIGEWGQGDFFSNSESSKLNWKLFDFRYYLSSTLGLVIRQDVFLSQRHSDIGLSGRPNKFGSHWLLFLRQNQNSEKSLWWWIKIRNF